MARSRLNLQEQPVPAERWEYNEPNSTYWFHLRKGVKFHDGSEFGGEEVKYSFDLIATQEPSNLTT